MLINQIGTYFVIDKQLKKSQKKQKMQIIVCPQAATTMATLIPSLPLKLSINLFSPQVSKNYILTPKFPKLTVLARFGGPSRSGGRRPPRQQISNANEGDEALDIGSIRSSTVRLIDQKQNMIGVLSKNEAIQMADDAGLDLVILSPDAEPPVVRIMDYSKFRYEQQKKKRDQQKKSNAGRMDQKELKMGYNISGHDYSVRLRAAQKFLKDGDKVKVIVNLKGRENEFRNNAIELIRRFQEDVGELATEESKNFSERNMNIVLVPNKVIAQKAQELPKKEPEEANEVSAGV